jgi:hypothetical protein
MKWLPWARKRSKPAEDPTVVKLAAQADSILEELDVVVKQMARMLRDKATDHE